MTPRSILGGRPALERGRPFVLMATLSGCEDVARGSCRSATAASKTNAMRHKTVKSHSGLTGIWLACAKFMV